MKYKKQLHGGERRVLWRTWRYREAAVFYKILLYYYHQSLHFFPIQVSIYLIRYKIVVANYKLINFDKN